MDSINEMNEIGQQSDIIAETQVFGEQTQNNIQIACIDTETTGLDVATATMLTAGIVRVKLSVGDMSGIDVNRNDLKLSDLPIVGMLIMKTEELYFCPPDLNEIPPEASKVNGLTMEEMVKHRDEFRNNLTRLAAVCDSYIPLMKNKHYDVGIISNNFKRYGITNNVFNGIVFDEQDIVGPIYKKYMNDDKHKGSLTQHVQMFCDLLKTSANVNFHTALDDAKATVWCTWNGLQYLKNNAQ